MFFKWFGTKFKLKQKKIRDNIVKTEKGCFKVFGT